MLDRIKDLGKQVRDAWGIDTGAQLPPDCDKSKPPPGPCICEAHQCTMMRKDPASGAVKTGCKTSDECAFVPTTGTCKAGSATMWIESRGGFCACSAGTCTPEFVPAIACKTTADCSWLDDPRRPVPSAKAPRPHSGPIKPCVEGSIDSVCAGGVCTLRMWKC